MRIAEIIETKTAFGRKAGGVGRKYRCTSGPRAGRTVANPSTCYAPKNVKRSNSMKRTRARLGSKMKVNRSRTMRTSGRSKAIQRLNRGGPKGR